jgi:6-phosphogluconolactonase
MASQTRSNAAPTCDTVTQNGSVSLDLIVVDDAAAAARRAGELLAEAARDGGHVALSGGKTPEPAHETAATLQPDWNRVELWWSDERCVPADDERSNFAMAKRTLLDKLEVEPARVHRVRGEIDPEAAAAEYDAALRGVRLRLNVLGLGPDGHTASLFPHAPGLQEQERLAIAAEPGLDPRVMRVTMTPPMLANADCVLFLVTGEEKADAARRAFEEPASDATPAGRIRSRDGQTIAVLDRAAAAQLSSI